MAFRCAFLSMDSLEGFFCDDDLAIEPLRRAGHEVEVVSWRARDVDWNAFDAVVIRSPWDYQQDAGAFFAVLEEIEQSRALLLNPLDLVRWNLRKTYLRDLEARGVRVVNTVWDGRPERSSIRRLFTALEADEVVLKPVVGANADHVLRVRPETIDAILPAARRAYAESGFFAQPFRRKIVEEGEYSVVFLGGAFSHALLKTAAPGDFRVQEEHGGGIAPVEPDSRLLARARLAHDALPAMPLYARVDLVRDEQGDLDLMELELIEPCLYFRMDHRSPARFANALERRLLEESKHLGF